MISEKTNQQIKKYFHGRKSRCKLCGILKKSMADRDCHMDFIHGDKVENGKANYTYRNKVRFTY